jgi:hypothetical protein
VLYTGTVDGPNTATLRLSLATPSLRGSSIMSSIIAENEHVQFWPELRLISNLSKAKKFSGTKGVIESICTNFLSLHS